MKKKKELKHDIGCASLQHGTVVDCDCGADGMNISSPVTDLVQKISKRLSNICLREGGMLDIETKNIPTNSRGKITVGMKYIADDLKKLTIELHQLVLMEAP